MKHILKMSMVPGPLRPKSANLGGGSKWRRIMRGNGEEGTRVKAV
jgi:hypothetical protein